MMFAFVGAASAQNANVSVSNLSNNSYYGGYDNNSKIISGIYFKVLADGTNSLYTLDDFQVSLYLLEVGSSTPIKIKNYTISGMHHFASWDFENESVDLSTVSGLTSGQYRLGVWANSDYGIPQPPDQGSDNAYLIRVDDDLDKSYINFTAGAVQKSDLKIENASFDFNMGEISNFVINVKNSGAAASPQVKVTVKIEDANDASSSMSQNITLNGLAAGASYQLNASDMDVNDIWWMHNHTYKMTITVDADNTASESNENNNVYTIANIASGSTAIATVEKNSIVLPNPILVSQLSSLPQQYSSIQSMKVFSALGSEVSLNELNTGVYFLQITTARGVEVHKVVVQ